MKFSSRELATVLAALRFWQNELGNYSPYSIYAGHFHDDEPLTAEQIDDLCEALNTDYDEDVKPDGSIAEVNLPSDREFDVVLNFPSGDTAYLQYRLEAPSIDLVFPEKLRITNWCDDDLTPSPPDEEFGHIHMIKQACIDFPPDWIVDNQDHVDPGESSGPESIDAKFDDPWYRFSLKGRDWPGLQMQINLVRRQSPAKNHQEARAWDGLVRFLETIQDGAAAVIGKDVVFGVKDDASAQTPEAAAQP